MRLFARRVVNLGDHRLLPGQEFITNPKGPGALSWRRIGQLYTQRRVISENDPYFEELMRGPGMQNNPEFAQAWFDEQLPAYQEVDEELETPVAPPRIEAPVVKEPETASDGGTESSESSTSEVIVHEAGGGWYDVLVNGERVSDKRLRKAEVEEMAEMFSSE